MDEGGPSDHTWPSFLLPGGAHCLSKGAAARGLKAPIGSSWTPWPAPGWSVACQDKRETEGRPEAKIRGLSLQGPVRRQSILTLQS